MLNILPPLEIKAGLHPFMKLRNPFIRKTYRKVSAELVYPHASNLNTSFYSSRESTQTIAGRLMQKQQITTVTLKL